MANKILNMFKSKPVKTGPAAAGSAGFDNARENIDPHIKSKVIDAIEGIFQRIKLAGTAITASAAEINYLVGVTSAIQTQLNGKQASMGADDNYVTDAEKTNITTLTNDSMADALHRHSELSASDGTPNPALQVDAAGNVGIGTTAPSTALDVRKAGVLNLMVGNSLNGGTGAVGQISEIILNPATGVYSTTEAPRVYAYQLEASGTYKAELRFDTYQGAGVRGTRMTIDGTGNVGIGTTGPGQKLEVNGNVRFAPASGITVYFANGATDLGHIGAGSSVVTGSAATDLGINAVNNMVFGISNVEKMRIKSDGNVGIGTTTPATSAMLEISSTTGALLLPRMTTTQRDALTAVNGMLIYNSTLNKFQGYENGAWTSLI